MKIQVSLFVVCTTLFVVNCIPRRTKQYDMVRVRRSPDGMMITGFYGHHAPQEDDFIPDGHQDGCHGCDEEHGYPQEHEVHGDHPQEHEVHGDHPQEHGVHGDLPLPEDPHVPLHEKPSELPGSRHGASDVPHLDEASTHREVTETAPHAPSADSDEDDDSDSWPILKPGKGVRPFFNFFPISFGGHGRSGGIPSGSTAIANSFSTGRGGIATSSSTSFGNFDPAFRHLVGNYRQLKH